MPLGRRVSPGNGMAAVGRSSSYAPPLAPWGHREYPVLRLAGHGGVACHLSPVWQPWKLRPFPGPRMVTVGAWPVPGPPYGHRGGVACLLGFVWPPWGRRGSPGPRTAAVGRGLSPMRCTAGLGAWLVPLVLYGCRGGVARPKGPYGRRGGVARPLG